MDPHDVLASRGRSSAWPAWSVAIVVPASCEARAPDATADRLDALVGQRRRPQGLVGRPAPQAGAAWRWTRRRILERADAEVPQPDEDVRAGRRATSSRAPCSASSLGLARRRRRRSALWSREPCTSPRSAGLIFFALPWLWLWYEAAGAAEEVRRPAARRDGTGRPGAAGRALAGRRHARGRRGNAGPDLPRSSAASTRSRTWASRSRTPCKRMCDRVPNLDLRFFVTSVAIQRQTGGDLAEILDKIGHVIRERFKILGQVKALTAEGRLSGHRADRPAVRPVPDDAVHEAGLHRAAVERPDGRQDESIGAIVLQAARARTRSRRSWTSRSSHRLAASARRGPPSDIDACSKR